ncbi:MAG TPA: hypothetical protein PLU52_03930, partial [Opitutaceae bacterium]|nr:hypothetical protein [Opitutaceae bacterium]
MKPRWYGPVVFGLTALLSQSPALPPPFPAAPAQAEERTAFQTAQPWNPAGNLPADVAIAYGIDPSLPDRVRTWRERGYRVHMMTGASWGEYYDYFHGRWDGRNHEDEIQTLASGERMAHPGGGGGYYMCPTESFGEFLWEGVRRGLDAGVEAVHLEESEYWAKTGYAEAFKREWRAYYHEEWQPPQGSVDAQWRASKLKYYLFQRVLRQVFSHVRDYNQRTGRQVRCYVPTHSVLNYAYWRVLSAESSLAEVAECDGYIGQVWTGSTRVPNRYQSETTTWNDIRERPFETAFCEYGLMANLSRATGRRIWFNGDPVEDDPKHDWTDYRLNWEATLAGALMQTDVWRHEVAPWPERVFGGIYPTGARADERRAIPPGYATELQVVMRAMADLRQDSVEWDSGTRGFGVLISDSLMFQRELPAPSDATLAQVYGFVLPLMKRGVPVQPVQLEYVARPGFLDGLRVLLLSYEGQKPLSRDVHAALAAWVRAGGVLVMADDDRDPYHHVREWWNDFGHNQRLAREDLFAQLGITEDQLDHAPGGFVAVGRGAVRWVRESPTTFTATWSGALQLTALARAAAARAGLEWRETSYVAVRRGPYRIAVGLEETPVAGAARVLRGRFVDLFDPELKLRREVPLTEGARAFLLDLDAVPTSGPTILAAAGKILLTGADQDACTWTVEGVGSTNAIVLLATTRAPRAVRLDGHVLQDWTYDPAEHLLHVRF